MMQIIKKIEKNLTLIALTIVIVIFFGVASFVFLNFVSSYQEAQFLADLTKEELHYTQFVILPEPFLEAHNKKTAGTEEQVVSGIFKSTRSNKITVTVPEPKPPVEPSLPELP